MKTWLLWNKFENTWGQVWSYESETHARGMLIETPRFGITGQKLVAVEIGPGGQPQCDTLVSWECAACDGERV